MKQFNVSPEFKTRVTDILNAKKFSAVFQYMNLVNREGNLYTEAELNGIVQVLGEFSYSEVSDFFKVLPDLVTEVNSESESSDKVKAVDNKK